MNSNNPNNLLYLHKGYFVQSKTNKLTDDYLIGKVQILLFRNWEKVPMVLFMLLKIK